MRALALFLLAICFVSVSALTGYEKAGASHFVGGTEISAPSLQRAAGEATASLGGPVGDETETGKTECACKQKSGSLTLSCGITLALSGDDLSSCLAGVKQAWFAFTQPDRNAQMMYLLKRPPRNIR